jgi:hypothetical protein
MVTDALGAAGLAFFTNRVRNERNSAAAVQELGGQIQYGYQRQGRAQPIVPQWLRNFTGDGVVGVDLSNVSVRGTGVGDEGLRYLRGCSDLQVLTLSGAQVSDAGLKHLTSLPQFRELGFDNTSVTDEGIKQLAGVASLRSLSLQNTSISKDGLAKLRGALPHCTITP